MVANADNNRERIMALERYDRWAFIPGLIDSIHAGVNRDMAAKRIVRSTEDLIRCNIPGEPSVLLRVWEVGLPTTSGPETWYIARDDDGNEWARARLRQALRQQLWRMEVPEGKGGI